MTIAPQQPTLKDAIKQAHSYFESGRFNDCRNLCQQLQTQSPNLPRILHLLALLENKDGHHLKALEYVQAAIKKRAGMLEFHNTLGLVYMALGKPAKAHDAYMKAYELLHDKNESPYLAMIYGNIANSLNVQGKYEEAIAFHKQALSHNDQDPFALWNLAHIHLLHGRFEEGWEGYEYRFQVREMNKLVPKIKHNIPRWDGCALNGKRLLVHDEQGYGDIIQFSRYLPKLAEFGGEIVFETRQPLFGLFKHLSGINKVCLKRDAIHEKMHFDYHIHLCSLPGIFSTTLDNIPARIDNLFVDPDKTAYWSTRIPPGKLRVGIVWTGNLNNTMLRHRSCPLSLLKPLLQIEGVTFIGLQKGEKLGEINELPITMQFPNLGDAFNDFSDTAAVINQLDLVITIDTAIAHLAGALGKPVWMLLSYPPDFRWLLGREDSPWYPSMRIIRQTEYANWQPVIESVTTSLLDRVNSL